jgi:excisionase family DNA binding protein
MIDSAPQNGTAQPSLAAAQRRPGRRPGRVMRPEGGGFTVGDIARLLRISVDKVRALIRRGELKAHRRPGAACGKLRYVVMPWDFEEFLKQLEAPTPKRPRPARRLRSLDCDEDYFPGD